MLSNQRNKRALCAGVGRNSKAQTAGVSVSELKPLMTVEAAIVNANCL